MRSERRAERDGIFVQQDRPRGYCVTFPYQGENGRPIFPTPTYRTFGEALKIARLFKQCDARLNHSPIYCLQSSWRKRYASTRILQLVEV